VVKAQESCGAMMVRKKRGTRSTKPQSLVWIRASISFPAEIHRTLEELAREKKVSLAWVVRDAADKYIAEQKRLLREK
jgi:hypothetical protein